MFSSYNEYFCIKRIIEEKSYTDFFNKVSDLPDSDVEDHKFKLDNHRTLGVPRSEMPQLGSLKDYFKWLLNRGIKVKLVVVSPNSLWDKNGKERIAHAQEEIDLPKAYKFVKDDTAEDKNIVLTKDGRIFDGNHRWLALMGTKPDDAVSMYCIDMEFEPLKELTTKYYPNVEFEA